MARVFAKWTNVKSLPEDISEIHISCGVDDDQWVGFHIDGQGASLTIKPTNESLWEITFTAPSDGLEDNAGYWLSPSLINDETEADDFGIDHDAAEE